MANGRVLVIHTGGTIGMKPGPDGYEPVDGWLPERAAKIRALHDPDQPLLTTPPSRFGRRVSWEIQELRPLLDSAEVGREHWVRMAEAIAARYDEFDGFVVVHGTDTMAYTAAALSFMLEGLGKSVLLTGSQLPLANTRNDAVENLQGAIMLAGLYEIPEVGIFFADKLMRGNRTSKVDASGLDAFRSGSFPLLVRVGTDVDVRWDLVQKPSGDPLNIVPITSERVAALRLFPSISWETLERFLEPPLQGLVLETYGAGNAPSSRDRFLDVLGAASARGVVVVSVSQCQTGHVTAEYAAGRALLGAGVVPGADMTPEAALTKLQWLLSQDLEPDEVRARMQVSLRGELTIPATTPRFTWRD
ncbi:MAG: type I asparaginase [Proteobacteria bacterium]|nr:type I asparaginase [Pseudomonadota bacterium]